MKVLLVLLVVGVLFTGLLLTGDKASAQQYPQVTGLQPFSPAANYMSLPGYLRWQAFVEQGVWISHNEAIAAVRDQFSGMASQPTNPQP
jgi:hypothetical protein